VPSTFEAQLAEMKNRHLSSTAEHFYDLMLESCERLFDNDIEQQVFEDQMRYMFGIKESYKIFTIDKLIGAAVKQVQNVLVDPKSQELLELLKKERKHGTLTTQDQINNRQNAERILGPDENLFRIDWLPDCKTMTVQLLGKDDSSFDDSEVSTGRWQAYIDSYVASDATENLPPNRLKRPFLRKNISPAVGGDHPEVLARGGLEIKVCVRTYRFFYVSNTEEILWRIPDREEELTANRKLEAKKLLRKKWMESAGAAALLPTLTS